MINRKFIIYCQFCALGKMMVEASSLDEAIELVEANKKIECREIVRLLKSCKVDRILSHELIEDEVQEPHVSGFTNWGSE